MGLVEEHWCNVCHKEQKKGKDDYVEFEFPKWEDVDIFICPECGSDNIQYKKKKPRWKCMSCKKEFDKPKEMKHKDIVRKKGIICRSCIKKDEKLREALGVISKASNPSFVAVIECLNWGKCNDFRVRRKNPVRCGHIAVIEDRVYCKRGHPGVTELAMEKSEKERYEQMSFMKKMQELVKRAGKTWPGLKESFEMFWPLNKPFVGPSGVIEASSKVKVIKEKKSGSK